VGQVRPDSAESLSFVAGVGASESGVHMPTRSDYVLWNEGTSNFNCNKRNI
jgi:hypothetical protein